MGKLAVIDTETNWENEVMSIGIVLAEEHSYEPVDFRYYILAPECSVGGMYSAVMDLIPEEHTTVCGRRQAMCEIRDWLCGERVSKMFAYNACFDRNHLPELGMLHWYDIMRVAAYRQHNTHIPRNAPCCSTGRLRSQYGVEPMLRLLSGDQGYAETHNALCDAEDELTIMKLLGLGIGAYECARI